MKLIEALRLDRNARLALVGAGGKTSALLRLGREFLGIRGNSVGDVWLSATTHLSSDQLGLADHHIELREPLDFEHYLTDPSHGLILFTGAPVENNRTAGVNLPILETVKQTADDLGLPLIFEADGSKRLPIKAPAQHEPVIPTWVNHVVVVAGLSALGKPLSPEWVHRPELFAQVSGLTLGEKVTRESLVKVLGSPAGGLKGIPGHARKILLLNQVYSPEEQAAGRWIASQLQGCYHAIVLAQLQPPVGSGEILAVYERTAGVVLAAGASTRLGRPKQLLQWQGRPLVYHAARIGLQSGLNPVIVVTGSAGQEVAKAVDELPVQVIHNPNWQEGQSTAVVSAIQVLPEDVGAAIFLLSDQPLISVDLVRELATAHAEGMHPIVAPLINGQRSNPVLFDRQLFQDLSQLSGDVGGRVLFSRYPIRWVEWIEEGIDLDIDTEQDYSRLVSLGKKPGD